jgi:hypothetical protein
MKFLKRNITPFILISLAQVCYSQVQVSNLDNTQTSWGNIQSGNWRAGSFTTDNASYTLDSVTVRIHDFAFDDSSALFFSIWNDSSGTPGSEVTNGLLSGAANPFDGDFAYTTTDSVFLAPNTTYWIVSGTEGGGRASWSISSDENQTGNWTIGSMGAVSSTLGASWSTHDSYDYQFSVSASAVPEPSTYALLMGLGTIGLALCRRKGRAAHQ